MLKILLAVPKSDCHCVVNQLLHLFLKEVGHNVINLGTNTSNREIGEAIHKNKPDLVLISCQNGHAVEDLSNLHKYISKNNTPSIWIGGKITNHGYLNENETKRLFKAGITKILPTESRLTDILHELKALEKQYAA